MLYRTPALEQGTGGMLRPGGLELTSTLVAQSGLAPGARLLDLGCGPGHSLALLSDSFRVTGLDASEAMLIQAGVRAAKATLIQARAEALPLQDSSFDGVLAECVLSLCAQPETVLTGIHRILRPGGCLLLSDLYLKNGTFSCALPKEAGCLLHAAPLEATIAALTHLDFEILYCQDQSRALMQLAGQLIFDQGSLEAFWQTFLDDSSARQACSAVRSTPPGYFALLARKQAICKRGNTHDR
ncbi:MAG: class I SAM-dependent methyltransferase [Desulfobulbaceae bacterium]|nr:class I SAM-dependent methyltransferase [Desulfobulbaceae bacterium]